MFSHLYEDDLALTSESATIYPNSCFYVQMYKEYFRICRNKENLTILL